MQFLLIYLLCNVLISVFLEKRKFRLATVFHTVAFVIISFLLLLASANGTVFSMLLHGALAEEVYNALFEALVVNEMFVVAPIIIIEWIISLSFLAFGAALTVSIVIAHRKPKVEIKLMKTVERFFKEKLSQNKTKIYLLHCLMRC